ncbi:hypothetical protein IQ270_05215 [Microcoleus sp. LEGE 07076]|nr:hypothetical protein [Microcoleus sp. LEGE 07076]MBE9184133.1 hypothetical protein [Microcoleus sp. LEGE 07076]
MLITCLAALSGFLSLQSGQIFAEQNQLGDEDRHAQKNSEKDDSKQ